MPVNNSRNNANEGSLRIDEAITNVSQWISFEFFPPKSEEGVKNLFKCIDNLKKYNPIFLDVTWGAGGSTSELTLDLVKQIAAKGFRANMHLTCTNMERSTIDMALKTCADAGIVNILALRGDPPAGTTNWTKTENGFSSALDLVNHIRHTCPPQSFCVSVAGYPEGHPNKISTFASVDKFTSTELLRYSKQLNEATGAVEYLVCTDSDFVGEMKYLKAKVDAGATMIITQMFFDAQVYIAFVAACRQYDINVPVIPGIMAVSTYAGFQRMVKFCKTRVPEDVADRMEELKASAEKVKAYGVELGIRLCRQLLEAGAPGLHFYTLNSSVATSAIIDGLGLMA